MISVIMSGAEDTPRAGAEALYTELIRHQGHNKRRNQSHDYVDPDTLARNLRTIKEIQDRENTMQDTQNTASTRYKEETCTMRDTESTRSIEDMGNIEDSNNIEGGRTRLDTGGTQRTEYFFMLGPGQDSQSRSFKHHSLQPGKTTSIMDKIE